MTDDANEIECRSLIEELYTFLDGEITDQRRVLITQHMHGCIDCHEVVEFHAQLKLTISQKCREEVPPELRHRISRVLGLPADDPFPPSGIGHD